MEIIETPFEGLFILEPRVFSDERGYFFESFNAKKFEALSGSREQFVQDNQSLSQKGVLRGMHFQRPPYAQAKLVRVIAGSVLDVVVDLRLNSSTYGKHFSVTLSDKNHKLLFIPEGFAHGFLTLEENTIFSYKCTEYYHPHSEGAILWNDPDLKIDWGISAPTVSEKDRCATKFSAFSSPFEIKAE